MPTVLLLGRLREEDAKVKSRFGTIYIYDYQAMVSYNKSLSQPRGEKKKEKNLEAWTKIQTPTHSVVAQPSARA